MKLEGVLTETFFSNANRNEMRDLLYFCLNKASKEEKENLYAMARSVRDLNDGPTVFLRGLIEFSSFCRNDCFYCGLSVKNEKAVRYRMKAQEIVDTIGKGYEIGFRSFVLQSGEDPYYSNGRLSEVVAEAKRHFPNITLTLSVGVLDTKHYLQLRQAGVDRFLLRHETADEGHFSKLHDENQHFYIRKQSLETMKKMGYQIGAGFMIGSPYQSVDTLTEDLLFLRELSPHMIGLGPFRSHQDTKFADFPCGSVENTLVMTALCRLMLPKVMIPATTALASSGSQHRAEAFRAGANVVMPCLTPINYREAYSIYDGKLSSSTEAAENVSMLIDQIEEAGMKADLSRGDHFDFRD